MDLDEEDQEGKVIANKIFPSGISSGIALALAMAAAISTLADEDDEELKFDAVSCLPTSPWVTSSFAAANYYKQPLWPLIGEGMNELYMH